MRSLYIVVFHNKDRLYLKQRKKKKLVFNITKLFLYPPTFSLWTAERRGTRRALHFPWLRIIPLNAGGPLNLLMLRRFSILSEKLSTRQLLFFFCFRSTSLSAQIVFLGFFFFLLKALQCIPDLSVLKNIEHFLPMQSWSSLPFSTGKDTLFLKNIYI